jgi:MFS family permease
MATLSDIVPPKQRTVVFGIVGAIYSLGAMIAPALVGSSVNAAHRPLAGYDHAFLILGAALVVGAAAGLLLINPGRDIAKLSATGDPRYSASAKVIITNS